MNDYINLSFQDYEYSYELSYYRILPIVEITLQKLVSGFPGIYLVLISVKNFGKKYWVRICQNPASESKKIGIGSGGAAALAVSRRGTCPIRAWRAMSLS